MRFFIAGSQKSGKQELRKFQFMREEILGACEAEERNALQKAQRRQANRENQAADETAQAVLGAVDTFDIF